MPPERPITVVSARTSSPASVVSVSRTIRQSGSFIQRRPCIQNRESVLRIAFSVEAVLRMSRRSTSGTGCQNGATSGEIRAPFTTPIVGPIGLPQARMKRSPTASRIVLEAAAVGLRARDVRVVALAVGGRRRR